MLAWASLVHTGTFLAAALEARFKDELGLSALRKILEGHGRWEGQMAHLRGYRE